MRNIKYDPLKSFLYLLYVLVFLTACNSRKNTDQVKSPKEEAKADTGADVPGPIETQGKKAKDNLPISDYVRNIYEDSKGRFWFGTNSDGVAMYNAGLNDSVGQGKTLKYFSAGEGLSGHQVREIIEDKKGNIWIGTNGGVSVYNNGTFTNYGEKEGLGINGSWSLFQDSKGNIWAGTQEGLCRFDGNKFIQVPFPPTPVQSPQAMISSKLVWDMAEDKNGNIWLCTDGGGVCVFNPNNKSYHYLTEKSGLCNNSVCSIIFDKNGHAWMSTMAGGLTEYDGHLNNSVGHNKTFNNINTSNGIGNNEVWRVYEDKKGNIWLTSEGFGVYKYKDKILTNYGPKEGLHIPAVQSIFEDSKGRLWFGGGGGVYRYDGITFTSINTSGPWE